MSSPRGSAFLPSSKTASLAPTRHSVTMCDCVCVCVGGGEGGEADPEPPAASAVLDAGRKVLGWGALVQQGRDRGPHLYTVVGGELRLS